MSIEVIYKSGRKRRVPCGRYRNFWEYSQYWRAAESFLFVPNVVAVIVREV